MAKIKSFKRWAEENNEGLDVITDTENAKGLKLGEKTRRTGVSKNYPPQYVRGQYPEEYFVPGLATAVRDLKAEPKTPPNTAAN